MAMLRIFKSTLPFVNYVTAKGKQLVFMGGRFMTAVEEDIKELDAEVKNGHPHIFIDAKEQEVDEKLADPMAALKHKIIQDYLRDQAAATLDPARDMGTSEYKQVKPASSQDIGAAMAGGSGAQLAAQIANIQIGPQGTPTK
jgi:acid phosphatase class B